MGWFNQRSSTKKKISGFILIVLAFSVLSGKLVYFELGRNFENDLWDLRVRATADESKVDPRIKLVLLDQFSLDMFEHEYKRRWPLPRDFYSFVLKFLQKGGAKVAAFDILFTEAEEQLSATEDRLLAEAAQGTVPTVSSVVPSSSSGNSDQGFTLFSKRISELNATFKYSDKYLSSAAIRNYSSIELPVSELINASRTFGSVREDPDSDAVFRHYSPGVFVKGVPVLSMAFATLLAGAKDAQELATLGVDQFLDSDGRLALKFFGPSGSYKSYSLFKLVSSWAEIDQGKKPEVSPEEFRDSYVLIGYSAPGLLDLRPTPLDEKSPGVEIHATALDNLLHRQFIKKSSKVFDIVLASFFIFAATAIVLFLSRVWVQVFSLLALLALFVGSGLYFAYNNTWIQMFGPFVGIVLSTLSAFILLYALEGRQRRFLKEAFRHYVSPDVIERIIEEPSALSLGGERRELSIFFSDLEGFTTISERLEATQLVPLLNIFLSSMTDVLTRSGGTLDKYVGDAIIAFWNAPVPVRDHPLLAVRAAIECQRRLQELRPDLERSYGVTLKMRVGVHTGVVNVGNFGSNLRFNYTMIGDAANLASRLEGANKHFGTETLLSGVTYEKVKNDIPCRKVGDLIVLGRNEAVSAYEPLANWRGYDQGKLEQYQHALALFEQKELDQALRLFESLHGDPVSETYINRIRTERAGDLQNWSAIWRLGVK